MVTFFVADTHFGHTNILTLGSGRPFSDIVHMNETIVTRWNAVVEPDDTVYHLGDVALGRLEDSIKIVGRLNGTKILVPGNHDRVSSVNTQARRQKFRSDYLSVFDEIADEQIEVDVGGFKVLLCHFPYTGDHTGTDRYAGMRPIDTGLPLVHGHIHAQRRLEGRMFNAGVDVNGYAPVSSDVVIDWVKSL